MKRIIFAVAVLLAVFTSCDDKLDIIPKGQTTLETVTDLEYLLNNTIVIGTPMMDLGIVCNECYGMSMNVPSQLLQTNTNEYAWLAYDEKVDRAALTSTDSRYNEAYKYINYMNTIIEKAPHADGDDNKRKQIIAEAHIMRAYLHWLLVNIYAKQYDAATAATEGGIPYVRSTSVFETKAKNTVAEVYEYILEDCSEENISALPLHSTDVVRGDQAWGNAVRAKALMQMKRYSEALVYAQRALEINGTIEDRSNIPVQYDWILPKQSPNNYIYMNDLIAPFGEVASIETMQLFEPGDYVNEYACQMGMPPEEPGEIDPMSRAWSYLMGYMISGVSGAYMFTGMSAYVNAYGITAERMYYVAAECMIRTNQIQEGLDLVNKVREYRIDKEHYAPLSAETEAEAMALLQPCKWIECIATYENFFDCKRWNSEPDYRRTITRTIYDDDMNPVTYELSPDSPLWVFPFPADAVSRNPTLTQNY